MKRLGMMLVACALVTGSHRVWSAESRTNEALQVVLELSDGSRVIGTPGIESVPVQTSYARITDLSDTGDFTVSLWTYVQVRELQGNGDGRGRERQYIFDTHTDAVSGQYRTGFFMVYDLLGPPVIAELHNGIQYQYGSKGDEYCEQSTRVDVVGGWHHMVFARRGLDDYSYLDGKVLDSTYARQMRREGPLNLNHTWSIGACAGNSSPEKKAPFKGRIDEIMVFNRVLSAEEVKAVYEAQK